MQGDRETNPYAAVKAGSEVHTLDGQKIGVIAELRGRYFKIKTPWWQRDYWLRTDSVRSAEPRTRWSSDRNSAAKAASMRTRNASRAGSSVASSTTGGR